MTAVSPRRPRLAVLLGDAGGVGPEMAVRLLARSENREKADILLVGDAVALASGESIAAAVVPRISVRSMDDVRFEPGHVSFLAQEGLPATGPVLGECTEGSGAAALRSLKVAVDAARSGVVDGIVFAPLNKHALRLAGMTHEDELRYMQERFGVEGFTCEFNITEGLWTSRVTSHVPLKDVARLITKEAIGDAVRIVDRALRKAGKERPRIAVSGLNPHAGDGGSIGMEEIEVIAPAVQQLRADGLDATGPWSPDTVFIAARRGDFDAVVSMYHDQGQIAMKLMGFERGVTLHGGLPVPVATSASGSAFDIAGKGIARVDGLQSAFDLCARMARQAA